MKKFLLGMLAVTILFAIGSPVQACRPGYGYGYGGGHYGCGAVSSYYVPASPIVSTAMFYQPVAVPQVAVSYATVSAPAVAIQQVQPVQTVAYSQGVAAYQEQVPVAAPAPVQTYSAQTYSVAPTVGVAQSYSAAVADVAPVNPCLPAQTVGVGASYGVGSVGTYGVGVNRFGVGVNYGFGYRGRFGFVGGGRVFHNHFGVGRPGFFGGPRFGVGHVGFGGVRANVVVPPVRNATVIVGRRIRF